ncbi:uncharacterized protein SEPMUDRAFT_127854 [Sphaerulina musiva SO2202]|uniref:Uncharacterized protein n=1 Tax=Sphaerulina musiva (strain SO2202) TaxID=692275 RepID=M3AVU4_SPHMS|nr:uncharacterized protein SEPMUDRAFT_127854 [Sphaerulina musiva SO2202]EMF10201.1 hypothetical protein SEPMUDRAFT_127854 [Sphaerulina musiva SO2202]
MSIVDDWPLTQNQCTIPTSVQSSCIAQNPSALDGPIIKHSAFSDITTASPYSLMSVTSHQLHWTSRATTAKFNVLLVFIGTKVVELSVDWRDRTVEFQVGLIKRQPGPRDHTGRS